MTKTPFRISFFGGGTDYPSWYLKEGGAVLSTTIDKYCYISCRYLPPFFDQRHRIVWSHIETVSSISEILHPAVRGGLQYLGFDDSVGLEIHHQGDLPARSGMGSSSAFAVGLIKALRGLRGQMIGRHELALQAIELEQNHLKENVGCQDQIASAYGGFNFTQFFPDGTIRVDPVILPQPRLHILKNHLMLFYTGTSRIASQIASDVVSNFDKTRDVMRRMRTLVDDALHALNGNGDLRSFGELLHESWMLKRQTSALVSNERIDDIYKKARSAGALGGKLLGAGGTGFMLFFAPPDRHHDIKNALTGLLEVPFSFDTLGSTVIYYRSVD